MHSALPILFGTQNRLLLEYGIGHRIVIDGSYWVLMTLLGMISPLNEQSSLQVAPPSESSAAPKTNLAEQGAVVVL